MANKFRVEVEGAEELMKKLRTMSKGFRSQALLHAVEQGGEVIKREAQARAPISSGRLRQSIKVVPEVKQKWRARVGISWTVGRRPSDAFYGLFAELGTRPRERKKWRKKPLTTKTANTGTMRATPFLVPAFKAKAGEADRQIRIGLSRLLRKAAKRGIT